MTYKELIQLEVRDALFSGQALSYLSNISEDHTLDARLQFIDVVGQVIFNVLNSCTPFAFPVRTIATANLQDGATVSVEVFQSVFPVALVVGYWVEEELFGSDREAYEHLRNIGLNDDGLFYQLRPV